MERCHNRNIGMVDGSKKIKNPLLMIGTKSPNTDVLPKDGNDPPLGTGIETPLACVGVLVTPIPANSPNERVRLAIFGELASYQSREAYTLEDKVRWVLTMWRHIQKIEDQQFVRGRTLSGTRKIIPLQDNI